MGADVGVIRQVRRIPPERRPPAVRLPQPTRVTVIVDTELLEVVVGGAKELRLPTDTRPVVGDVVHLVERADGTNSPRCCYRLVTRTYRGVVTVLPGMGICEGRHG